MTAQLVRVLNYKFQKKCALSMDMEAHAVIFYGATSILFSMFYASLCPQIAVLQATTCGQKTHCRKNKASIFLTYEHLTEI